MSLRLTYSSVLCVRRWVMRGWGEPKVSEWGDVWGVRGRSVTVSFLYLHLPLTPLVMPAARIEKRKERRRWTRMKASKWIVPCNSQSYGLLLIWWLLNEVNGKGGKRTRRGRHGERSEGRWEGHENPHPVPTVHLLFTYTRFSPPSASLRGLRYEKERRKEPIECDVRNRERVTSPFHRVPLCHSRPYHLHLLPRSPVTDGPRSGEVNGRWSDDRHEPTVSDRSSRSISFYTYY